MDWTPSRDISAQFRAYRLRLRRTVPAISPRASRTASNGRLARYIEEFHP